MYACIYVYMYICLCVPSGHGRCLIAVSHVLFNISISPCIPTSNINITGPQYKDLKLADKAFTEDAAIAALM